MVRLYLKDMINNHIQSGEWKIQLVIINRCIFSKNVEESRFVYSASDNIDIFLGSDTDEVIDVLWIPCYKDFKKQEKRHFNEEANLFLKMLIYCIIIFIK